MLYLRAALLTLFPAGRVMQIMGKLAAASSSARWSHRVIGCWRAGGAAVSRLVSRAPGPQQDHGGLGCGFDEIVQAGPPVVIPGW
jgi:hypothetical protein